MSMSPEQVYSNDPVNPLYDGALLDNVALEAGALYPKGQLLAAVAGTGTAVNDVQTLTVTGTPAGGSAGLFWRGLFVGNVAFNSTAAQLKTTLEAFFGAGNVDVTGGPHPGTPLVVTFKQDAGGMFQPLMTGVGAYTGGTTPAIAIAHTTSGKQAGGYWTAYANATADPARRILRYASAVDHRGMITNGNAIETQHVNSNRGAPAYFKGIFRCSDLFGLDAAAVDDLGKLINGTAFNSANAIIAVGEG